MARPSHSAKVLYRATIAVVAFCIPLASPAETLTGKVVGVADGDTITVLAAECPIKVRLDEVDTPERGQPWATRAKQALSDRVFREQVEVRVDDTDCC